MGIGSKFGITAETGNNIQTEGLVAYWDAAYKKSYISGSTSTYNLASGSLTPTGSLQDGAGFSSANQGVFTFDGVDERILVNDALDTPFTTQYWSVDIWFNLDSTYASYDCMFGNGYPVQLYVHSGKVKGYLSSNAGSGSYFLNGMTSTQTISTETWYHLVWIRNGTNFYYYINGVLDKTASATGTVASAINKFRIGDLWETNNIYIWDGEIANLKVYNRALSAADALQNFNAQKDRFNL